MPWPNAREQWEIRREINNAPIIPLFFDFECIKLIIELKHKEKK